MLLNWRLDSDKKRLLENFFFLSVLQGANYILPLITLPYLVRVLGPEKFGLIAFAQAFIQYFNILTDYGFNLSATREISIHRENKEKIAEIFSSVMIIKFALLILSFIIMTIIVFSFEKFRKDWLIYYLTFGIVIGQALFPVWFFQGMERMKYITILNITAKLIFTVSIFVFVHEVSDYIYVPLLNSLGFLVTGILALRIVIKDFGFNFKVPSLIAIKRQLKEGWYIFISTVAISLYTISNTFILGLFTNNTIVGYYSAAEKIVKAVQGLITPVSQTIYPYISKLINKSKERGLKFIQKVTFLIGGISFLLSVGIFIFADLIVKFLLGNQYTESVVVLKILSFLPFIIALSNIFGIQTMLNFNYKKAFSKILVSASIINILLAFVLVPLYQHVGISFAVLISEIFVTVSMFVYLQKKGIKVLEGKIV
ncbi:polysaccharide biosynthesis protein [Desulfurobacterium thermolithotrophum DSM 11699]|uniref:Polysaccharide biosynthesis protein n=1 Tax=Desulfurobacterium thermolithotrophum (strain DSM 11699 / BSA) TaxID=868864 RepID=F0S1I7_DESTD|nr:flippase [Desulfurobacterium thermolithotrophum]ADY73990.1 polysaccharide biosynthesis protein [Desulfurobacterium thermolithotrophum DSM 11699]